MATCGGEHLVVTGDGVVNSGGDQWWWPLVETSGGYQELISGGKMDQWWISRETIEIKGIGTLTLIKEWTNIQTKTNKHNYIYIHNRKSCFSAKEYFRNP